MIPTTPEGWKAQVNAVTVATLQALPALREALHVKVEPTTIDGVKVYMATPETIPPENRNRLLLHVHGGCFVSFPVSPEPSKRSIWRASDASKSCRSTIACRPIIPIQPRSMTR